MKKIIAVLLLFLLSSSSFSLRGQKIRKTSRTADKAVAAPQTKTVEAEIHSVEAFSDGNGVLLKWQTVNETNLIGFNIYRLNGNESVRVNKDLILSSQIRNGQSFGNAGAYSFFDENGGFQGSYTIESIFSGGQRNLSKQIFPRYTYDLINVSALSSEAHRQSKLSAQPIIQSTTTEISGNSETADGTDGLFADPDKQKWVASRPGVKIAVKKEGFYRVSRTELEAAGFNVNASSGLWQLYLNGEEQAMIVEEKGQYIEFYGANFADTDESDKQFFYLLVGPEQGKRIKDSLARRISASVAATNFEQVQTKKERIYYIANIRNGDNQNFFGTFISDTPAAVSFELRGIDYNINKTEISVVVQGASLIPHLTKVAINGQEFGTFSGENHASMKFDFGVPTNLLVEGTNSVQFTALSGSSDFSFFDSISVNLRRKYTADQNQLSFPSGSYKNTKVGGFSSPNVRVFDLTYKGNPTLVTNLSITENSGSFTVDIPSHRQRPMYAVADDAVKQADSITQNTPSTLSVPANTGQLVIITHKNWMTEANAWANYRTADGFNVKVVDIEDIFDEFNYGQTSAKSITDFAQYAKNNWQTPPAYVLLMGDATYDPRNYTGIGNFNFVPTKMVNTVYTETGSDDALTDFNNDGLAEIPIGRLPVRSAAEVVHLLNKVGIFEQTVNQAMNRGATCASDVPNGYDFAALCSRVLNELPSGVNKNYINRGDANAPAVLLNDLNSGKYIVNYSGHGHTTVWAAAGFFSSSTALTLTNGNNLSIFTMLTCLNGYFIEPATNSLSESLLKAQNGGAVAVWSSSGLTTPDHQEVMARRFYNQLGVSNMTRLGDLINDSKTVIPGGRDVRLSWVLLGDPTLKVK
ncbi:hypothetical protein BH20ACI4_BH20ACI4_09600 [soil metagenome]